MFKRHPVLFVMLLVAVAFLISCQAPAPQGTGVAPQAPLLVVERSGGIAGFQDRVVIGKEGELYASVNHVERIGALVDAGKRQQLDAWSKQYAPFTLTLQDNPNGPDNMIRQLTWNGSGSTAPTTVQQEEMLRWAEELFAALATGK